MYSLAAYGEMIAEGERRRAYVGALERAIRPGCVVLEIGTGPGVIALLAARLGARKVYAVEASDVIQIARQIARSNGLGDRVELLQGLSTELDLPERADVVVSDLRDVLPLFRSHLPSIIDARERLLEPGGILIPQQDSMWGAVVDAKEIYLSLTRGWSDPALDLDLRIPLDAVTNTWKKAYLEAGQCLVEPQRWAVLDYRTIASPDVAGRLSWTVSRAGRAHGLALWFDTVLSSEIGFSNAPGQPKLIYGQGFFPFPRPVDLGPGDHLEVVLEAVRVGEDYVWRWTTRLEGASGARVQFEQSTFQGVPFSSSSLRRRAASYVPDLDENGRIASFVLARLDGRTSLEEISRALQAAFPARFAHWRDALTRVGDLVEVHC